MTLKNFRLLHKLQLEITLFLLLTIYYPFFSHINSNDKKLLDLTKITKRFLQNNSNLTKADKGNITVTLDKDSYTLKINEMPSD